MSSSMRKMMLPRRRLSTLMTCLLVASTVYLIALWNGAVSVSGVGRGASDADVAPWIAQHNRKVSDDRNLDDGIVMLDDEPFSTENSGIFATEDSNGVDLAQIQLLDFLNGEENMFVKDKESLFGGSLENPFSLKQAWSTSHAYALGIRSNAYNRTDFIEMGRRARALHIAYRILHDHPNLHDTLVSHSTPLFNQASDSKSTKRAKFEQQLHAIIDDLTRLMYPWLVQSRFKSLHALQRHFRENTPTKDERGIIYSTGRGHFELAVHAIQSLRTILKSDLPIEVHHMGPNDLDADMIKAFNAMPGVMTVDVWDYWGEEARQLGGWAIKPFALLASRFTKVMFIDADSVFVQDPDVLFSKSEIFEKYGQLFYHDRTITGYDWCYNWFNGFVPYVSHYANSLRFQSKNTVHEQESGVVVIDKSRTEVLHGLLTTCRMNMKVERDGVTYKKMHGDKESYWMSWELARVPYKFSPSYGGTIGYKNDKGAVCGGLFHTDEYLQPLWWNGGVVANKHVKKTEGLLKYEFAAYDLEGKDIEWEWETTTTPFCLKPKFPGQKVVVMELSDSDKRVTRKLVRLYSEIIEEGWRQYFRDEFGLQL
ncbi:mannosyltransferase putative-domain-containing protein [Chytriomyces sp. MP71]|nr:mannosyltransferase putative-domain-containing protein [Chytriomyces sp. MP71]